MKYLKRNNEIIEVSDYGLGMINDGWVEITEQSEIDAYLLQKAKTDKISEANSYYLNDNNIRLLTLNNLVPVRLNLIDDRLFVVEQIQHLEQQINLGLITEQEAEFDYYVGTTTITVTLNQLRGIYVTMMNIANTNQAHYIAHIAAINALTTINAISSYDFTTNYLKNQNLNIV